MKATQVLPAVMAVLYSSFVYLTYVSPETLWVSIHDRERPMDPVWSYAVKAKGAAITGLLVALLLSFTKPLPHRFLTFVACGVFQFLALLHHGSCYLKLVSPDDFFVDSDMHLQYVVMHSTGSMAFAYLAREAANADAKSKTS